MKARSAAARMESVSHDSKAEPKLVRVRQNRIDAVGNKCSLSINGKLYSVLNYSAFGVAIQTQGNWELQQAKNCLFLMEDQVVAQVDLKFVRSEAMTEGHFKVGFEVTGPAIPVERLAAFPEVYRLMEEVRSESQEFEALSAENRLSILTFKSTLQKLKLRIDDLEQRHRFSSLRHKSEFENLVINQAEPILLEAIRKSCKDLATSLANQPNAKRKRVFEVLRAETKELLFGSPFMQRTLEKPLGYAGDFEMMSMIYRKEDQGQSLFHRCIERRFLDHHESQAVRNRVKYIREKIFKRLKSSNEKLRILSVASGPAVEIQELVEICSQDELSRMEIHLLDQELISLQHAQHQVNQNCRLLGKTANIEYHQVDIRALFSRRFKMGEFDLIYSSGLFDYFTDEVASLASKILVKMTRERGEVIIGNFDPSSPGSLAMEAILDWSLIYRTKEDLVRLFSHPECKVFVESEDLKVNLFANIQRV